MTSSVRTVVCLGIAACAGLCLSSCFDTSSLLHEGIRLSVYHPERAAEAYTIACDHGSGPACTNLGALYDKGRGVPKDHAKAAHLFKKACEMGAWVGCDNIAIYYRFGMHGVTDHAKAATYYQRACDGGIASACWPAVALLDSPERDTMLLELAESYCDEGTTDGCLKAGTLLVWGDGVAHNLERALRHFQYACKRGSTKGCEYAADLDLTGDPAARARSWERLCEGGDKDACYRLGIAHWLGNGVPLNKARKRALFERSCTQDHAAACVRFGMSCEDPKEAVVWFEKGCTLGDGVGCYNLAVNVSRGEGTARDEARVMRLLERGCALKDTSSCVALDERRAARR